MHLPHRINQRQHSIRTLNSIRQRRRQTLQRQTHTPHINNPIPNQSTQLRLRRPQSIQRLSSIPRKQRIISTPITTILNSPKHLHNRQVTWRNRFPCQRRMHNRLRQSVQRPTRNRKKSYARSLKIHVRNNLNNRVQSVHHIIQSGSFSTSQYYHWQARTWRTKQHLVRHVHTHH